MGIKDESEVHEDCEGASLLENEILMAIKEMTAKRQWE